MEAKHCMEQKIKCQHCGRCIGFVQSTDKENGIFEVSVEEPKQHTKKEHIFHCTCQRCKNEIYILMGFKN